MNTIELRGHQLDALVAVERPLPRPRAHDVLVRLNAASLNYRDYAIATGQYQTGLPLPFVPLSDGAGDVIAVGEAVTEWHVGDRVTTHYTTGWQAGRFDTRYHASKLGGPLDGALQTHLCLPETAWVRTPNHLRDDEAATLPIAALTAWNALRDLNLAPGEMLLVQGTGSVSLFALQFARQQGLRVLATTTKESKAPALYQLGAEQVIDISHQPNWSEAVLHASDGEGVAGVIDVGGNVTLPQSLASLRGDGGIALVGFLGGFGAAQDLSLPILSKRARIYGQSVGSRESFVAMNRAIAQQPLHPVIDRVFAFADFRAAYAHVGSGAAIGKTVIRLSAP